MADAEARAVMYGLAGRRHPEEWTPTETLFAFMGWMTSRHHDDNLNDCALMVHRIQQFCDRHDLKILREGWDEVIIAEPECINPSSPTFEHWLDMRIQQLMNVRSQQQSYTD